jgi:hypothetical protein
MYITVLERFVIPYRIVNQKFTRWSKDKIGTHHTAIIV